MQYYVVQFQARSQKIMLGDSFEGNMDLFLWSHSANHSPGTVDELIFYVVCKSTFMSRWVWFLSIQICILSLVRLTFPYLIAPVVRVTITEKYRLLLPEGPVTKPNNQQNLKFEFKFPKFQVNFSKFQNEFQISVCVWHLLYSLEITKDF